MRFLSFILFCLIGFFPTQKTFSQSEHENKNLPTDVKIPPAIKLTHNLWLASVNQFVLIPLTGKIAVYYTGIFNTDSTQNTYQNFILPFPKEAHTNPFVTVKLEKGIQQIQDSALIETPLGSFNWNPGQFKTLPGVTIIILKDPSAKITMKSANFIHDSSLDSPDEQYVRVNWNNDTPYPQFYLHHLIPSRLFTYLIIGLFAFLIFTLLVVFVKIKKARSTH